jgi:single-strand DNA-binding protein
MAKRTSISVRTRSEQDRSHSGNRRFSVPAGCITLSITAPIARAFGGGEQMRSINHATIMGNVGRDPDIRFTQNGRKIARLSVATTESWKDKASGERVQRTEWHRIVIMNEALASIVEQFVRKGSTVHITGKLQTRHWIDKDKQDRYTTEIVLLPYAGDLILLDRKEPDDASLAVDELDGGVAPPETSERPDLDEVPL